MCCTASNGIFTISISVCRRAGIHLKYIAGSGSKVKSTGLAKTNNVSSVMVELEKTLTYDIRYTKYRYPVLAKMFLKKNKE
jgi:hypothetical protein